MKNRKLLWLAAGIIALLLLWWGLGSEQDTQRDLSAEAFVGDFQDEVTSSGELMAENSEDINGPTAMRRYGIYNVKISELVPEGTYVSEGDFVAMLDKSELTSRLSDAATELDKAKSQYTQVKLDTALTLREKRSNLESLRFDLRQKRVELEQSKYEPPATIQRVKLDIEKLEQTIAQTEQNYQISRQQNIAKMNEAAATLAQEQKRYDALLELEKEFRITAPKQGMVIYKRFRDGSKRSQGSSISAWNSGVAELPDLSVMESRTFINEVDVRKVKKGQPVKIGLDAFPDARLSGTVISVANVGEERDGAEGKVFEVNIRVHESDSTYRPGMTTSNNIITDTLSGVLQIPLEAVFTESDTSFVYARQGVSVVRQRVKLGPGNDTHVVIRAGLEAGATVYLNEPAGARDGEIQPLPNEELSHR